MEPRNRSQGMNSACLCSLAGRYDNPIPSPHRLFKERSAGGGGRSNAWPPTLPPYFSANLGKFKLKTTVIFLSEFPLWYQHTEDGRTHLKLSTFLHGLLLSTRFFLTSQIMQKKICIHPERTVLSTNLKSVHRCLLVCIQLCFIHCVARMLRSNLGQLV
jgi:hypothetical protein